MKELIRPMNMANSFFVKSGHMLHRVNFNQIQWVHSDGNYCTIHTADKKFAVKISLTKLKQRLPMSHFVQIHRSYIVQTDLITNIDLTTLEVYLGEEILPLGRTYKDDLIQQLNLLQ